MRLRAIAPTLPMTAVEVDGAALAEWRHKRLRQVSASLVNRELNLISASREAFTRASKKITNVAELARAFGHRGIASLMIYYHPDVSDIADKLD